MGPWRPTVLRDVEAPTLSKNWLTDGVEFVSLTPQEDSWYSFPLDSVYPMVVVQYEELGQLKESNDLVGNRTRDLPACSIPSRLTTLSEKYSEITNV
jgi:hypothetical protein